MTSPTSPAPRALTRSASDRLLAGVCGGLADHLRVPAVGVRAVMLALTLAGGAGAMLYLWLWVTVPLSAAHDTVAPMRRALTKPAVGTERNRGVGRAAGAGGAGAGAGGAGAGGAGAADGSAQAGAAAAGGVAGAGRGSAAPVAAADSIVRAEARVAPHEVSERLSAQPPGPHRPATATPPAPGPAPVERLGGAAHGGAVPGAPVPGGAQLPGGPKQVGAPPAGGIPSPDALRRGRWPVAELLFGACLLLVGVLLVLQQLGVELRLTVVVPGLAVLVGVGLTWWQVADRNRPDANQVPRVLGALSLVAVGVLMFFVTAREPSVWTVIAAALAALAGVALAIAPWLLRQNRELIAERAAREREAERSEIAAHLHDSVLQTLALIQQRSEPGTEVARIARGQERELREWLFRGADGGGSASTETALEELRAHAATLEDAHAVRFETVGVGAEVIVPEPIVAAAKEAMLNAARHAGGAVTVFAEVTPARVAIDVTDRGPGVDPDDLPPDRMGVRESILGRMARAGGTARIVPGPGGHGTSVRLAMPRYTRDDSADSAGTGGTS